MTWFKGNLHTHTARSDGDINLDGVVHWYASRGYDWLAITDHNLGLLPESAAKLSEKHGILTIRLPKINKKRQTKLKVRTR